MRDRVKCTQWLPTFDDNYHADMALASASNCLITHPEFGGEPRDCEYQIPGFRPIVVPGLSESAFHVPVMPLYLPTGAGTQFRSVRLPGVHVLLNQALKAVHNSAPYDWTGFQESLGEEVLRMLAQTIDSKCMRTQVGEGFMAIAQANPNQPQDVLGIGNELAVALVRHLRHKYKDLTVDQLNGVYLPIALRFPATRSSGVKRWMTLRVVGRGRCCWMHPIVLKQEMLGDVDGDQIFVEVDSRMRRKQYDPFIPIAPPNTVTPKCFKATSKLSDCRGAIYNKEDIYIGLTSKEGIGQVTNAFYRCIVIAHEKYQWTHETREEFLTKANRPDLLSQLIDFPDEQDSRCLFRYLSAEALMDCFSPLYEACFDARKDTSVLRYIQQVLAALRNPLSSPLDFTELRTMTWEGKPIQVDAFETIWDAVGGQLTAYVNTLPVQALFFEGDSDTLNRRGRMAQIIRMLGPDPAQRIWKGLNNEEFEKAEEE